MSTYEPPDERFTSDIGQQQIQIMTQLMKVAPTMYSIDEFLHWLAYAITQRFGVQLTQFWMPFINSNGMLSTHLRMMAAQDPSLPDHVVINDQMMMVVKRVAHEQRDIASQPVDILFPPHRASLLKRYGLNFCAGSFMNSNVLLPPPNSSFSAMKDSVPFSLTTLLFLSHRAPWELAPAVSAILKQAIKVAANRELLLPISTPPSLSVAPPLHAAFTPSLFTLIPRRKEGSNLLVTNNPFAREAAISDKQALRLHMAINGKKNVADLCRSTNIDKKDISASLQTLLKLQRIELLDAEGNTIDATLFFPRKRPVT